MPELTIADVGAMFDGPHATPTRRDDGPYFLNISSLEAGRLDLAESDHVSDDDFRKWTRRVTPRKGDLLFSYETRLGAAAMMPGGVRACLGRRMALIRPDESVVDPRFLLYFYLSPGFQQVIESRAIHGATVSRIPLKSMGEWRIQIPQLGEQRGIAEVLGALDDKIAANRQILERADELVRARYARELAEADHNVQLGDIASNIRKQVAPEAIDPDSRYVGLEHLPRRRMWVENTGSGSDVASAKAAYEAGDVLFGKLRPYFHKVAHAAKPGVCSTDILVIRARDDGMSGLVLGACAADETVAAAVAASEGTRMPRAKWADIAVVPVPNPSSSRVRQFSCDVTELAMGMSAHIEENERLAATRDALLPLLMSGRVRVKDIEDTVGELV